MKNEVVNFTDNGTQLLADCVDPNNYKAYEGLVRMSGSLGGGTFKLQISDDDGTTKSDTGDSYTAVECFNVRIPALTNNDTPIKLYGVLSGASSPTLSVRVTDNRQ